MKVSVGVSNRHIHLKKEDLEILFGKNYKLENIKSLNQPDQFMSNSKVKIKTDKDEIDNVRIIGELREYTQVEISKTDAYKLGINPPIRKSGDIKDSSPITIVGPNGELNLKEGCIIADRHIHITPKQKELYGFNDVDSVSILINGEKSGILNNVHFSVSENAYYELHLDTDDANAFLLKNDDIVTIIKDDYES